MDIKLWIFSFFTGVLCALYIVPFHPHVLSLILQFVFCIALIYSLIYFKLKMMALQVILAITIGHLWVSSHLYWHDLQQFPKADESKVLHIRGTIATIPIYHHDHFQFQFNVNQVEHATRKFKIQLAWYREHPTLIVGQTWELLAKLKRPHGFANPGSFDYEAYVFDQGIVATGYVVKNKNNHLMRQPYFYWKISVIRQALAQQLLILLKDCDFTGIILALTLGIREFITPQQWQIFLNTGTNHLVVIAGLHVGMFAGLCHWIANRLWRSIPLLCNYIAAPRMAAVATIIGAIIYATLAGLSLPTQRALIMLSVFMLGVILSRLTSAWHSWWIALLLVLLFDPFAPVTVSFCLSFAAVAAILYATLLKASIRHKLLSYISIQFAVFIGLIPFTLLWFMQFSLVSVLANAVAIPVVGLIVVPSSLLSILLNQIYPPLAQLILTISLKILKILFIFLNVLSHVHSLQIAESISSSLVFILSIFGIVLLLAPLSFPGRSLAIFYLLPLFFTSGATPPENEVWFQLLDVGQGLASVIRTHKHVLVFDTGPKYSEEFDTGQAVVVPYLKSQHIHTLDAVVISHSDNDHRGGLESVLRSIDVKRVYVNDKAILSSAELCQAGVAWQWDGISFQFLTVPPATMETVNDRSCVLKVSNKFHSLLLTGDIETKAEKALVEKYKTELQAEVIIAPHHGSKTSSSVNFVTFVKPRYVLFANGYLNRYHFPHPLVVQRYQELKVQHYATDQCGMITWQMTNNATNIMVPGCYRQQHWRVWYN